MTTEKYRYPEDQRFKRIAEKIADSCMAFNAPIRPSPCPPGTCCPLSALIGETFKPSSGMVVNRSELNTAEALRFIVGFEGGPNPWGGDDAFYHLGYAYRQRYTRLRPT